MRIEHVYQCGIIFSVFQVKYCNIKKDFDLQTLVLNTTTGNP
jgi:hypothetical protein